MRMQILILLLLVLCNIGWTRSIAKTPDVYEFDLFDGEEKGSFLLSVVDAVHIHSVVEAEGVLVAIGEFRYHLAGEVRLRTFSLSSIDGGRTWKKDNIIEGRKEMEYSSYPIPLEVVAKGSNVYVLASGYDVQGDGLGKVTISECKDSLLLISGKVVRSRGFFSQSAGVEWNKQVPLKGVFPTGLQAGPVNKFFRGRRDAIVTEGGLLVFLVCLKNENSEDVPTIIYSVDDGIHWKSTPLEAHVCKENCNIFEWGGRLMLSNGSYTGHLAVYESINMGREWTEAKRTFSRVWASGAAEGGSHNLLVVTIEGKRLLIFTRRAPSTDSYGDGLNIWLSDGEHFFDIGHVTLEGGIDGEGTLLYSNGKLLYFYKKTGTFHDEVSNAVPYDIGKVAHLDHELEKIKAVVEKWRTESVLRSGTRGATDRVNCVDDAPAGLFLNDLDGDQWKDTYNSVSIKAVGAKKTLNGILFSGPNRGATWTVSNHTGAQLYNFANYEFTLGVTVEVPDRVSEKIPVVGVVISEGSVDECLEVSYTSDDKWYVTFGGRHVPTFGSSIHNETHQVTITMYNGLFTVNIDGAAFSRTGSGIKTVRRVRDVMHFYIGGYGEKKATPNGKLLVKSAVLFKRELTLAEVQVMFMRTYWPRCPSKAPLVAVDEPQEGHSNGQIDNATHVYVALAAMIFVVTF
ncbi:trans-sialidase, putative [Trypanosoma equiperdum]|uniref:Trans-sialidase, putative n=2 Tax=Trypanozoon TaxID=39700 RepID=Q383D7_TRYB2|nr:trans-sialidase, putative [Trypanosoma brucei brucei TREU927]EAN80094.1 trans-sialidase, putative [Trypanosoma brucei brucei TREU927]SCU70700.1 trans-sialidase, putative [Trypanosoma equiperdum]